MTTMTGKRYGEKVKMKDITTNEDLIAFGDDFFDQSAKAKRKYEQTWMLALAFLAGDQLLDVNSRTNKLERIKVEDDPDWAIRTVDNRILPVYRAITSKLTQNRPLPTARAHNQEEADIEAARGSIKLLEYHWDQLDLNRTHAAMVGWLTATGNCFYKQFWNEKRGPLITEYEIEGEIKAEGANTEIDVSVSKPSKKQLFMGDTDLLLRSPFNVYVQPGKTSLDKMSMIGDCERIDADEVFELYGVELEGGDKESDPLNAYGGGIEEIIEAGKMADKTRSNMVTVKELYILPCQKFPDGIMFRWAGSKLLGKPQPCSKLPFVHFRLIHIPGKFWGKGMIEDIIPIQKRWNSLLSKIEMHNDLFNDPPIIMDPNYIDPADWTTQPGLIIEKLAPGGDPPYVLKVPNLDQSVYQELQILDQQFELVPVVNKVTYGKDTPNARSGLAINFLQEKDDAIVWPLSWAIENAYVEVFKQDFELCQKNYDEDRGFSIVGKDNKVQWVEFKKADLRRGLTIGVEPGSAMPRSKVAQQAMVLDMLHEGFFTDPNTGRPDFAKALRYMEFGSVDDIYEDVTLDVNQARRENERMKQGEMVVPENWHNHQTHIYEHNRIRKTAEYEIADPAVKQAYTAHIDAHLQFMQPPAPPQAQPAQAMGSPQALGSPPSPVPAGEPQTNIAAAPPSQMIQQGMDNMNEASIDQAIKGLVLYLEKNRPEVLAQIQKMPVEQQRMALLQLLKQGGV